MSTSPVRQKVPEHPGRIENKASSQPADQDARAEMTDAITRLLTAQVIVKPFFPKKELLPPLLPPAFTNHGHLLHFDYQAMLEFVWQTIFQIQSAAREWKKKRRLRIWLSLAAFLATYILLNFLLKGASEGSVVLVWLLSLICFGSVYAAAVPNTSALAAAIAEVRANAIQTLLDDTSDDIKIDNEIKKTISANCRTGDGRLSDSRLPVLIVINNNHPFPGYGRLQLNSTFVCPPKEKSPKRSIDLKAIDASVRDEIVRSVNESAIPHASCGEILAVDGWTIPPRHWFLETRPNGETVPPLWCDHATAEKLDSKPRGLSARKYFAVEILFPQFETVATIFARPFLAGNSIAYQISVATLGEPTENGGHILKQLAKHDLEKAGRSWIVPDSTTNPDDRILQLRSSARPPESFQTAIVDASQIAQLKLSEFENDEGFKKNVGIIVAETARWPGAFGRQRNWREEHSYSFTTRFFGLPEAVASVRSIYVQISKAILRSLEALDFDTAAYQDVKGHYSINVEKIDQMLVADNISVGDNKKDAKQQTAPQGVGTSSQQNESKL